MMCLCAIIIYAPVTEISGLIKYVRIIEWFFLLLSAPPVKTYHPKNIVIKGFYNRAM